MSAKVLWAMAGLVVAGCNASGPTGPAPAAAPVVSPPVAPVAAPPAGPNTPPTVTGDFRCISPLGIPHVFPLLLQDAEGDRMTWVATKEHLQGDLSPLRGEGVASGETITITYVPPLRTDENWIRLTVTDARGAATTVGLYVKNH